MRRCPSRRRRVRGARRRGARALRRARRPHRCRQGRRRNRAGARRACAGRDLRRGADHARHVVPERLPGGGAVTRHARRRHPVLRDRRCRARRGAAGRRACAGAHRRAPGRRRGAAEASRAPRRAPLGRGLLRSAPLSRSQPDHVRVDHAGRERRSRRLGWRLAAGRRSPRASCGRPDARPSGAARGRRAARAPDARHRRGVRRGHRRRRARRSRRCGVRGVRGPAHDRDRAGGARRAGRVVVADRELPRLPGRRLRRRAQQARAAAGTPARRGDPRHAHDHRARSGRREPFGSTAATSCAGARSSWPPA